MERAFGVAGPANGGVVMMTAHTKLRLAREGWFSMPIVFRETDDNSLVLLLGLGASDLARASFEESILIRRRIGP